MSEQQAAYSADALAGAIRHANDRLAWIEARKGPLPDDGFTTIETSVGVVRALGRGEMGERTGDGYTDEQRAMLRDLVAKLPPMPRADESDLVRDLRAMLDSQGRVSEQHRRRVQELAVENERLRWAVSGGKEIIDGQAARIRALTAENARLRERVAALEAERDEYRAALQYAERNVRSNTAHYDDPGVAMCALCDQVGLPNPDSAIAHAPDCPFAALAGQPAAGGA